MGNKKLQVWLPLLFSIIMIAGMFVGYRLNNGPDKNGFFKTSKATTLQEALELIRLRYVDKVNLDTLQTGAIQEMMTELDPHSIYFPPVELKQANEELAGNFEGIGVEFNVFNDTVNVLYVLPAGPSDKAGVQTGDKIISVNDSTLTGASNSKIREFIRGERGSKAILQIVRNGTIKKLEVTRGTIPVPSVDAAYMVTATTGYIKLNKFSESSYREFMEALESLQKMGMQQLIYDLRGNGGGFMNDAIDMADEFLDGDKLVVYTQGTNSPKTEYECKRPGLFEKGKLVLLVDELSASASEVLAGALQDWDRATIIGRRTFGKGLVQQQYQLSDGSALRLTVARYYTPIGRSIQRPYDKGKKVYMDEIWERYSNGESLVADSNKVSNGKLFKTVGGRTVYGGGGIMPDIFVPIDTATYPRSVNRLFVDGSFNGFVYRYYLENRKAIDQYKSSNDYVQHFNGIESLWSQFVSYANKDSVNLAELNNNQQSELKNRLVAYLARFRWRNAGYFQVINANDKVMLKALETIKAGV